MLKIISAILFTILLAIPTVYTSAYWGSLDSDMIEELQETNNNANNIIEEEHKLINYISVDHHYFPLTFVLNLDNNYYHTDEWLYKYEHLHEFFQPPNC